LKEAEMPNTWVVVADSGSARIFTADTPLDRLTEKEDYAHSEARVSESKLVSDRQGRTKDSQGRRHAFSAETSPREAEARAFARLLAGRLQTARTRGDLERLLLIAAPEFLGLLRASLDDETRKRVQSELPLNLVSLTAQEIRARLPERLYPSIATH
jgi:protein required for attachment to host cells